MIATIHQPSGRIFKEFDRLLLLQEGYQLYQGPLTEIAQYLKSQGMTMAKYQNVADYIIKMAQAPGLCRFNLSLDDLKQNYEAKIGPKIVR